MRIKDKAELGVILIKLLISITVTTLVNAQCPAITCTALEQVNAHGCPGTSCPIAGAYAPGQNVVVDCEKGGNEVNGSIWWGREASSKNEWIPVSLLTGPQGSCDAHLGFCASLPSECL